jgi:hypothetical protein
MITWQAFAEEAPGIAELFRRRHAAAGNLCFLATLRRDGYPRISPMEPRIVDGQLVLVGMTGTRKFHDLARDPRFSLHTASEDPHVSVGDAKVWGRAVNDRDKRLHERFADELFAESGFDLRGQAFDPFFVADLEGAASVAFVDGQLTLTTWKPGQGEQAQPLG